MSGAKLQKNSQSTKLFFLKSFLTVLGVSRQVVAPLQVLCYGMIIGDVPHQKNRIAVLAVFSKKSKKKRDKK